MDYCINGNEQEVEKAILHLYKNKLFADVTVTYNPGNIKFYAHKLILSLYSPVLSDIFYEKCQCHTLDFENIELSAVQNLLSFCYGEQLVFKNINHINDTKGIAEKYGILALFKICLKEIDGVKVDASNVLALLEISTQNGNKKKEKECLEVISRNHETVFTSELFMKMGFEAICQILERIRGMNCLTEVQYLRSALEWMACNDSDCKEKLTNRVEISKLSVDEFVDIIISFPNFFTNTEIVKAFQNIKGNKTPEIIGERSVTETESDTPVKVERADVSSNVQEIKETDKTEKKSPDVIPEQSHTTAETLNAVSTVQTDGSSNVQMCEISNKKRIAITISEGYEDVKQALIVTEDGISKRAIRFYITEDWKDGLFLKLISRGNRKYEFNSDLTYNSLYFLLRYLNTGNQSLSPLNYIEVLKAACHFGLRKVTNSCFKEISNIIDFDPAFLDGLLVYPRFQEKVTSLLISNTTDIILHPNFINCSFNLIKILLQQRKLNVSSELDLLIVTISWLEARNLLNWDNRLSLLNEIAIENVNYSEFEYVLKLYPNFFTKIESHVILLYKAGKNWYQRWMHILTNWYNFKIREYST